jgi:hypothetical protein
MRDALPLLPGAGGELPGSRSYAAIGVAIGAFAPSVPIGI